MRSNLVLSNSFQEYNRVKYYDCDRILSKVSIMNQIFDRIYIFQTTGSDTVFVWNLIDIRFYNLRQTVERSDIITHVIKIFDSIS